MTRNIYSRSISILAVAVVLCCAAATTYSQSTSAGRARSALTQQAAQTNQTNGRTRQARVGSARRSPIAVRARAGDTLAALAARFNLSVEELAQANNTSTDARLQPGQQIIVPAASSSRNTVLPAPATTAQVNDANRLRLTDGSVIEFDDTWEDARGLWYRKGGVVHLLARNRVASIERKAEANEAVEVKATNVSTKARIVEVSESQQGQAADPIWIYLVGGARVEADEVTETSTGAWYRRGSLSIFLERSRIERIERERPAAAGLSEVATGSWKERGWTTGNQALDSMIRLSGQRFGVDPYLIFCVMEQESRFNSRALSPKGARGLMQLMPGTAARFGVRDSFDPQQNIMGGTRYLKLLLEQFGGRVDLVLASYNAGEGAVMKYGRSVPPYRETRDYVRRIGARYGQNNSLVQPTVMTSAASSRRK